MPDSPRNRILINMEGGIIQGIISTEDDLEVLVIDYDTEGCDENEISKVPQNICCSSSSKSADAYVFDFEVCHEPDEVNAYYRWYEDDERKREEQNGIETDT